MNEADALEIVQRAIWTVLLISGPSVLGAMLVGILIALFQALTQIQEVTLTFVPKIIVILLVSVMTASFIGNQIYIFSEMVYGRVAQGF